MELLAFLKSKDTFKLEKIDSDFIPYACLYDDNTIITKHGELIQTLKISSFSEEILAHGDKHVKERIKDVMLQQLTSDQICLYFHTIKSEVDLDSYPQYQSKFAADNHEWWCRKNYLREKFITELYISFCIKGPSFELKNKDVLLSSFSFAGSLKQYDASLVENSNILNKVIDNVIEELKDFGAQKLGIVKDQVARNVVSSQLQFFSRLINLHEVQIDIKEEDLSSALAKSKMIFGANVFESMCEKAKYFSAIFTIKDFNPNIAKSLTKFLLLPMEYVITQTATHTSKDAAQKYHKKHNYIMTLAQENNVVSEFSGLQAFMKQSADNNKLSSFYHSQLSVMIMAKSQDELEQKIAITVKELHKIGLVVVREDINLEAIFWSQLPGNVMFSARNQFIHYSKIATFASLDNSPVGNVRNIWGDYVSIFRLKNGAPYFFNFHENDKCGHSIIFGSKDSWARMMMNFLLTESSKYDPFYFFLDNDSTSMPTMALLGANINEIGSKNIYNFVINPFSLEKNTANVEFLLCWVKGLIEGEILGDIDAELKDSINFVLESELKSIEKFVESLNSDEVKKYFVKFVADGEYSQFFHNGQDKIERLNYFNLKNIEGNKLVLGAFTKYLVHLFRAHLDNSPAVLIVNSKFLEPDLFNCSFQLLLEELSNKNAILLALDDSTHSQNLANIMPYVVTKIIFWYNDFTAEHQKLFSFTDGDVAQIKSMQQLNRNFFLKQGSGAFVAELNLDGIKKSIGIFQGGDKLQELIAKISRGSNKEVSDWIENIYEEIAE